MCLSLVSLNCGSFAIHVGEIWGCKLYLYCPSHGQRRKFHVQAHDTMCVATITWLLQLSEQIAIHKIFDQNAGDFTGVGHLTLVWEWMKRSLPTSAQLSFVFTLRTWKKIFDMKRISSICIFVHGAPALYIGCFSTFAVIPRVCLMRRVARHDNGKGHRNLLFVELPRNS